MFQLKNLKKQTKLKEKSINKMLYLGNYDTFKASKDTLSNPKTRHRIDDFRRAALRKQPSGSNLTNQKLIFKQLIKLLFIY